MKPDYHRKRVPREIQAMNQAKRGLQFSVRTHLLITAAVALLLVPVVWLTRERRQLIRAQQETLLAREVALRSVVLEEQRRRGETASPAANVAPPAAPGRTRNLALAERSPAIERLQQENADLRQQLEQLRGEVEKLRNPAKPASRPER